MLTGWRPGVVDWGSGVFASCCRGSNFPIFVSAFNGWPHWRCSTTGSYALADQLPLPMTVKRGWSGFVMWDALYQNHWLYYVCLLWRIGLNVFIIIISSTYSLFSRKCFTNYSVVQLPRISWTSHSSIAASSKRWSKRRCRSWFSPYWSAPVTDLSARFDFRPHDELLPIHPSPLRHQSSWLMMIRQFFCLVQRLVPPVWSFWFWLFSCDQQPPSPGDAQLRRSSSTRQRR